MITMKEGRTTATLGNFFQAAASPREARMDHRGHSESFGSMTRSVASERPRSQTFGVQLVQKLKDLAMIYKNSPIDRPSGGSHWLTDWLALVCMAR